MASVDNSGGRRRIVSAGEWVKETFARVLVRIAGPVISIGVLVAALIAVSEIDFVQASALVPHGTMFWCVFGIGYLALPVGDWLIFRRLFGVGISGFEPLLRKLVANEVLLGYSGEVYFYSWIRRNLPLAVAPSRAIKDVGILSALVGNAATLLALVAALPVADRVGIDRIDPIAIGGSAAVLLLVTCASLWFSRRIFSLPASDLRFVTQVHVCRFVFATVATILLWHFCLPAVSWGVWTVLMGLRLLLARLPFVANADVVFAGCAAALLGHDVPVVGVIAMLATITVCAHLLVGLALGVSAMWAQVCRSAPEPPTV